MRKYIYISLSLLTISFLSACDKLSMDEKTSSTPVISDFSPKSGSIGTDITITGEHLDDVVKATIGGVPATLAQKVSNRQMVIQVSGAAQSGKIVLTNDLGSVESESAFTVDYPAPSVEAASIPTELEMGNKLLISGTHMNVISEVTFTAVGMTTGHTATVISQSEYEIVVKIPYVESDDANITFTYFDGEQQVHTPASAIPAVNIKRYQPVVVNTSYEAVQVGETVELRGSYLTKVDQVLVGDINCLITMQTDEQLRFVVPASDSFVDGDNTLPLSIVYFDGIETNQLTSQFVVKVPFVYFWEDRTVYAQGRDVPEFASFFSPETGVVYQNSQWKDVLDPVSFKYLASTCSANQVPAVSEAEYNSVNPYFFFSGVNAGNLQINSPAGSNGQLKNFYTQSNSANENRVTEANANCYGTPVMTYLYLNPETAAHQTLIDELKDNKIDKIDESTFTLDVDGKKCRGISIGSVSNSVNQAVFAPGVFEVGEEKSADIDAYLLVFYYNHLGLDSSNRAKNIKRIGILHIKHIDFKMWNNTTAPSSSSITFDMYWMKHDYDYTK